MLLYGQTGVVEGALFVPGSASAPYQPGDGLSREFLAGVARGRYVFYVASWRLSVGPELRVYSGTTDVKLDDVSVWEAPLVAAGITLDVSALLFGPR